MRSRFGHARWRRRGDRRVGDVRRPCSQRPPDDMVVASHAPVVARATSLRSADFGSRLAPRIALWSAGTELMPRDPRWMRQLGHRASASVHPGARAQLGGRGRRLRAPRATVGRQAWRHVSTPVHCWHGTADTLVPLAHTEALVERPTERRVHHVARRGSPQVPISLERRARRHCGDAPTSSARREDLGQKDLGRNEDQRGGDRGDGDEFSAPFSGPGSPSWVLPMAWMPPRATIASPRSRARRSDTMIAVETRSCSSSTHWRGVALRFLAVMAQAACSASASRRRAAAGNAARGRSRRSTRRPGAGAGAAVFRAARARAGPHPTGWSIRRARPR